MGDEKCYLGDGVYIELETETYRHMLRLTTSDGREDTNTIWLEPEVAVKLVQYIKKWGWLECHK